MPMLARQRGSNFSLQILIKTSRANEQLVVPVQKKTVFSSHFLSKFSKKNLAASFCFIGPSMEFDIWSWRNVLIHLCLDGLTKYPTPLSKWTICLKRLLFRKHVWALWAPISILFWFTKSTKSLQSLHDSPLLCSRIYFVMPRKMFAGNFQLPP